MLLLVSVYFFTQIAPLIFLPFIYLINNLSNKKFVDFDSICYLFKCIMNFSFECVTNNEIIEKGFILCNHKTWADFGIDQYYSKSCIVGRRLAFFACPSSIFSYLDNRAIAIDRRNDSHTIFKKIISHYSRYSDRLLIYPEGTRQNYKILLNKDDLKKYLKYGLLKRIYEYKSLPVQCFITANKDLVFNEKTRKCSRDICLKNAVSEPIFPCNYNCFEDFIDAICYEWFNCYELTHKI